MTHILLYLDECAIRNYTVCMYRENVLARVTRSGMPMDTVLLSIEQCLPVAFGLFYGDRRGIADLTLSQIQMMF